jgi:hypothetical protein
MSKNFTKKTDLTYDQAKLWIANFKQNNPTVKLNIYYDWVKFSGSVNMINTMPLRPDVTYKGFGWISYEDFLGSIPNRYRTYEEAAKYCKDNNIKTRTQYEQWSIDKKLPSDMTVHPQKVYKRKEYGQKWTTWGDYLGTERISFIKKGNNMLKLEDFKLWLKSNKITDVPDFTKFIETNGRPENIPSYPSEHYKMNFHKITGIKKYKNKSNLELKIFFELKWIFPELNIDDGLIYINNKKFDNDIYSKTLNTIIEYDGYYNHAVNIDKDISKNKALNNAGYNVIRIRNKKYGRTSYNDILIDSDHDVNDPKIVINLLLENIINTPELYTKLNKKHKFNIKKYLKSNCVLNHDTYVSFIDSDNAKFVSYSKAKELLAPYNLKSKKEFFNLKEDRLKNIPGCPPITYGKDFISWSDFLGYKQIRANPKKIAPYDQSKKLILPYVIKHNIDSRSKWYNFIKTKNFPSELNIPKIPIIYYKDKGWSGWNNWLSLED